MCSLLDQGIENFETDLSTLHPILTECRVLKSKLELDVIQYANDISSEAHVEVSVNDFFLLLGLPCSFMVMYTLDGVC